MPITLSYTTTKLETSQISISTNVKHRKFNESASHTVIMPSPITQLVTSLIVDPGVV